MMNLLYVVILRFKVKSDFTVSQAIQGLPVKCIIKGFHVIVQNIVTTDNTMSRSLE